MQRKEVVLDLVTKNPGIRFNEIMRLSNIRNGTLTHYVKKLLEEDSIKLERTPRVTRLYPRNIPKESAKICKFLTMNIQKEIILCLLNHKIATAIQIREHVNKSPSVISVNLNVLFKAKMINKKYDIPSNKYSLKNPEGIKETINEYYPELLDKLGPIAE